LARNIASSAEAGATEINKRGTIRNRSKNKKYPEQGLLDLLPDRDIFWLAMTFHLVL
jgi:hypothetical protein